MKKLICLIFALIAVCHMSALNVNNNFGFPEYKLGEDYSKYVNQRVKFYPKKFDSHYYKHLKLNVDYDGVYVITNIQTKIKEGFSEKYMDISIELQKENGKGKVKISAPNKYIWKGLMSSKSDVPLHMLPMYFVDEYENARTQYIGSTFSHKLCKISYKVKDILFQDGEAKYQLERSNDNSIVYLHYGVDNQELFYENHLKGFYTAKLVKVEKPSDSSDRYSIPTVVQEDGVEKYSFNDSIVSVIMSFNDLIGFTFNLKNVSATSIKVVWNETVYVDVFGNTSKLMHNGIKYAEREGDQPSTTILRNAQITDNLFPTDKVYLPSIREGWQKAKLSPKYPPLNSDILGEMRVMIPIQIKDVVNEYTFVFELQYHFNDMSDVNIDMLSDSK